MYMIPHHLDMSHVRYMYMQFVQGKLQLNDDLYSHNQHGKRTKYFPDRQYFVNDPGIYKPSPLCQLVQIFFVKYFYGGCEL